VKRPAVGRLRTLSLTLGLAVLGAGCGADDPERPGSPRTARTPLAGAPLPYAEAPENVGVSSDDLWLLKERLYSRMVARHVVGAEILVVVDGQIVLHQAMGWADREDLRPMQRNSIFRLASMTKPVAGTATLMLAEEGRVGLDEPVSRYLDSFSGTAGRIAVRQLLTNRSGFVQGGDPPGFADEPTLVDAVNLAGERGPTYEPGDRFIYSNLNSETLGAIVATVTGMPVERFIEERVLGPLRMTDTHTAFLPEVEWANRVPSSYRSWGGTSWERWWNPSRPHEDAWFNPAGDLFGSAFDYARFLQAWMDRGEFAGERLLEDATVEMALADPTAADTLPARTRWYAMQWEIYAPPRSEGGLPAFGHRGATGTLGMAIPDRNAIVVYLTNSNETEVVEEVIDAALEIFRGESWPR